jgi:UDP-N-acetylglucosamine--N-acetylmuramyl-(pentapeptide) pyrophosphoryl-undecaprenol N-acetylglucosamine transferase
MKLLIAGGGTGGHIYPAIAIAKAVMNASAQNEVQFVGTELGLETKIVPRENFKLHFVASGKLNQVSFGEKIRTLLRLPLAFFQSAALLMKYKPDAVLGVGGYASGPVLFVGSLFGFRTIIWEPNAYPGMANRWLSRFVKLCCVVFEEAVPLLKAKNWQRVPMPVRKEIEEMRPRVANSSSFRILVFGGSQGSRVLNNTIIEMLAKGGAWTKTTEIVHQTGSVEFSRVSAEYARLGLSTSQFDCREYLDDMPERYRWADLVIARSGTGTLSEISACAKAAILIPLPTAADDHQRKNAEALVKIGGARMILQKDLNADVLLREIQDLRQHPDKITELEKNVHKFHQANAAEKMAEIILCV